MTQNHPTFYLLRQLVKRDLAARYRGSVLGLVWMILTPLLLLLVYSFVFGVVFQAKWGVDVSGQSIPFPLLLFSGLIIHSLMSEVLHRSVGLMREHTNYIKKVVFPVTILPVVSVLSALSLFVLQFALLLAAMAYFEVAVSVTIIWLPLVLLPLIIFLLALAWLIAALGVFIPDLHHVVGLAVTVLLFMSPIFYPVSILPPLWQDIIMLNPLTPIIEMARGALFYAQAPSFDALGMMTAMALVFMAAAYGFFARLRPGFSDIL